MACRICYEDGDLISVCACKGTSAYVHLECIEKWRAQTTPKRTHCELCHAEYTHVPPVPKRFGRSTFYLGLWSTFIMMNLMFIFYCLLHKVPLRLCPLIAMCIVIVQCIWCACRESNPFFYIVTYAMTGYYMILCLFHMIFTNQYKMFHQWIIAAALLFTNVIQFGYEYYMYKSGHAPYIDEHSM